MIRATVILLSLAVATASLAADDSARQVEFLQGALQACRQQRDEANDAALQKIATLTVQVNELQRRLTDAKR